jgi:hypothetical protein
VCQYNRTTAMARGKGQAVSAFNSALRYEVKGSGGIFPCILNIVIKRSG